MTIYCCAAQYSPASQGSLTHEGELEDAKDRILRHWPEWIGRGLCTHDSSQTDHSLSLACFSNWTTGKVPSPFWGWGIKVGLLVPIFLHMKETALRDWNQMQREMQTKEMGTVEMNRNFQFHLSLRCISSHILPIRSLFVQATSNWSSLTCNQESWLIHILD